MKSLPRIAASTVAAVFIGSIGCLQTVAADEVSRGALLASMCITCHGADGKGSKPIPGISGEEPEDFVDLMKAFASGDQATSIMDRHAQGYTEAELRQLAEFFSKK